MNDSDLAPSAPKGNTVVPLIAMRNQEAWDWFAVYSALCRHAVADPDNGHLPENRDARALALARFNAAFEVL